ncbi:hypothetical protein C8Q79DRAFT_127871 [Trametes meyenii]|nr:hypothetical protein C8Q79DRAFT_127871 [Trametes meyenii]
MADAAPVVLENPIILNLTESYGPILVGCILSCVVWGISCMQMFMYYLNYDSDHLGLKLFVAFVWAVDTANEMLLLASMWPVLILKWGSIAELSVSQPTLVHHGWVSGIVAFAVQMFFLYRIYKFSGNRFLLPLLLVPLSLWQIIGTIPFDIWVFQDSSLAALSAPRMIAFETALRATSAFVDIMIAVAMLYLLVQNRRSEFSSSKKMIFRLIIMTINTGLWTAVVALVDFSLVRGHFVLAPSISPLGDSDPDSSADCFSQIAAFPKGLQFCALEFPLSSLYVNTLLANLNARQFLRRTDGDYNSYGNDTGGGSMVLRSVATTRGTTTKHDSSMAIRVDTSDIINVDYSLDMAKGGPHAV